ncbi:hypothetical protein BDN72DRAFT_910924 [Pluteus cervinus]|uniref:Uncharacterized protein n=1 Tax=Pluteus cervinus TaxID=181527 RepID=A0ACD3BHV4_9AGAR|nr:hypothetical protein BDN72DRAFT_910924 [Pluteus cervinus]
MGKGKNLNPADSFRKAQRKKELKKAGNFNKTERSKARDFALVKKDTWDLEDEIKDLEQAPKDSLPAAKKARLAELKAELEKINRKKAEYVEEHPEHRRLVYRPRRKPGEAEPEPIELPKRNLFKKNGLPRHPERSIYYDPVMNPYGVPPPGMPYAERPLRPDEIDSEDEMDADDDDIAMPQGPPPGALDEEVNSDEDIPMPEGPPPGSSLNPPLPLPLPPNLSLGSSQPPPPPGPPPLPQQLLPIPPPPPPPLGMFPPPSTFIGNLPPPPPPPSGFAGGLPPPFFAAPHLPPPPLGFFPRSQSASSVQDPLSSVPHQTYQAHRAKTLAPPHPSLPPKPVIASVSSGPVAATNTSNATISAAPQLRDFKKEATAFVPTSLKRKKAGTANSSAPGINAAPSVDAEEDNGPTASSSRLDLVGTLLNQFGPVPAPREKSETTKKPDDYAKFVEEMGDILNP